MNIITAPNGENFYAHGWIALRNQRGTTVHLLIEPSGLAYEMPPNETFYLCMSKEENEMPIIEYQEDFIIVHAYRAVLYHDGKELHNLI